MTGGSNLMEISTEIIDQVADLARLNFTGQEKEKLKKELAQILAYMKKLNELDTSSIEPTSHILPLVNVLREDKVENSYDRDEILANAPSKENGCFKVPKTVE